MVAARDRIRLGTANILVGAVLFFIIGPVAFFFVAIGLMMILSGVIW